MDLNGANILITGGTGSFGNKFTQFILDSYSPNRVVIFSRDELKQFQMRRRFPIDNYPHLRMFLGDVRDKDRVYRVVDGSDVIIHAAALKQVPTAEVNPLEVIKTNILGAANVIDAAIDLKVQKVIALSTDKAANPINLYGATKLCSDKLFVAANSSGLHNCQFSVVRYGNVSGSRGSVIPYFLAQRDTGIITITDPRMTRFSITLDKGVRFVTQCLTEMRGGEIYIPKIPSVKVTQLAKVIAPECEHQVIGIRPGEKLHETMITEDDARLAVEFSDHYAIHPSHDYWNNTSTTNEPQGTRCPEGFKYSSDTNDWWLTDNEIGDLITQIQSGEQYDVPDISEPRFIVGG
ncbi:MAG: UDP-N-acetylglucosamine 4,6-dehydratase (inverting) [Chloroflexi bacterium]|nr:UDP-N-acetylglucosamine 4,6-dehydratase (inverting) [Chloroflexota bacterium]|tara:strand:+ start:26948 stop:27994 length:1047 start_codon:yes stop_codon:yes gene_type:complete